MKSLGSAVKDFTMENWESQVLQCGKPVLVDFHSPESRPFVVRPEILEQASADLAGRIIVGSFDISGLLNQGPFSGFNEFPVLCLFLKGKVLKAFTGIDRMDVMKLWCVLHPEEWLASKGS